MFVNFFHQLKSSGIPVSLGEYLTLLNGLNQHVIAHDTEEFYYFARMSLVKDERHLDKFDCIFSQNFKGLDLNHIDTVDIPEEWLRKLTEKFLTEEEKEQIKSLGGWGKIMQELQKRLKEQKSRHQGGSKWIGTGGTSPFGAYGYNPEGIRMGQQTSQHRRAIKIWDKREFKNLDDKIELGTRNIKIALRRLRKFARDGQAEILDLDHTIKATAKAGYLDIQLQAERRNNIKILLFFDVGGSMDDHITLCEGLFSASRTEFKNMEYFYFHNCLYEGVWQNNERRHDDIMPTWDILHKYPADYKVIFVGDATMSPHEVTMIGGCIEYMNEEAGGLWLKRMTEMYKSIIWLNPTQENFWQRTPSTQIIKKIFADRMYPLTLEGIENAMRCLTNK